MTHTDRPWGDITCISNCIHEENESCTLLEITVENQRCANYEART